MADHPWGKLFLVFVAHGLLGLIRVVNGVLHSYESYRLTTCKHDLNHKRSGVAVFLSPINEIHFWGRQLLFSGREWRSSFVRFVRIDNLFYLTFSRYLCIKKFTTCFTIFFAEKRVTGLLVFCKSAPFCLDWFFSLFLTVCSLCRCIFYNVKRNWKYLSLLYRRVF